MPSHTREDIGRISVELANDIQAACAGKPTAAVYLAIAQILGFMETQGTKEPRRSDLFKIISGAMDDYISRSERSSASPRRGA